MSVTNVVTAPDSIQPATIDFQALRAKAMEHPAGNEVEAVASPEPTPAPAVSDPVAQSTPPEQAPQAVDAVAQAKILELSDTDQIRVKVDGKEEIVSAKDYRDGISREAVFTKRMQTLAEQRREAEAQLAAQYAQVQREAEAIALAKQQFAAQFDALRTPASQSVAPQTAPRALDPQELATLGDVNSTIEQKLEAIRNEQKSQQEAFVRALGEASQQVQTQAQLQRDTIDFTNHLQSVMSKPEYQVLNRVSPFAEEIVRQKVAAMEPRSMAEAKDFADTYVRGWYQDVTAAMVESAKRQEVAKAQARLEPPQGSAPPPVAQFKPGDAFRKDGKFDWAALRARAEGML
jgi:hypothetical protein